MIEIELENVKIDAYEVGRYFAEFDSSEQVQFLYGLIDALPFNKWAMQCNDINTTLEESTSLLAGDAKREVIDYIECLVEHLKD